MRWLRWLLTAILATGFLTLPAPAGAQPPATLASSRAQAMMAVGNPINFRGRQLIADFGLKQRLPGMFDERLFAEAGGLMSYAPSFTDLFRRAATNVDKILKGGAKPADLPVEQPTKFELVINVGTAKTLGLTIPLSLLLRADQLLE
jgi:putative ABC transport system substrate-binding protein